MKSKLILTSGCLALVTLLTITTTATPVSAISPQTWLVNGAYPTGCNAANHCKTIGDALSSASDGDTVLVTAGTYNVTQIAITKALKVIGVSAASTIIDGGGVTTLPNAGTVKITASTGNVTFSGFTVRNAGTCGTCGDDPNHPGWKTSIALSVGSSVPGVTYTISYNKIQGLNNPADPADFGFYGQSGQETLVFTYNQVTQTGANPITIEKHPGATDVSYNTFDRGIGSSAVDAYFNMNYGGANVTTLQKISYNTIDLGTDAGPYTNSNRSTAISFAGNFTGVAAPGGYTNVQIIGNTITNLQAYRRGIGLWNVSTDANGNIANAVISNNRIIGLGGTGSKGIQLLDYFTNATIQGNAISNVDYVFHGRQYAGSTAPAGLTISNNSFTNATTGFVWDWTPTLSVPNNWWGCVAGPTNPGCIPVVGHVNYAPFAAALASSTTASTHELGETGTLTTSLTVNGLYGAQLLVTHDASVLNWSNGITIPVGGKNWYWDIVQESFAPIASPNGRRLSGLNEAPHTAANLTGDAIAQWNYTCASVGTSALAYDTTLGLLGTKLSDKNGFDIPAAFIGDSIICVPQTTSADGYINLQGRLSGAPDPQGWLNATVILTCSSGGCAGYGPYVATTDATGHYQWLKSDAGTGVVTGTYTASVSRRAYLSATKLAPITVSALAVTIDPAISAPMLLGGDVNDSGTIDVTDLSTIGSAFGAAPVGGADTGADVNGDNIVNIFDLVLAGGNFGLSSSIWTP